MTAKFHDLLDQPSFISFLTTQLFATNFETGRQYDTCYTWLLSDSQALTGAIDYTGDTYNEIGDLFEKQVCYSV